MICPKCVQPKFVYPCTIPPLVSVYRPATLLLGEGGHVPLGAFTFLFLWVVVFFLHALWTFTRIPQPTRFLFAGEGVLSLSPGGGLILLPVGARLSFLCVRVKILSLRLNGLRISWGWMGCGQKHVQFRMIGKRWPGGGGVKAR